MRLSNTGEAMRRLRNLRSSSRPFRLGSSLSRTASRARVSTQSNARQGCVTTSPTPFLQNTLRIHCKANLLSLCINYMQLHHLCLRTFSYLVARAGSNLHYLQRVVPRCLDQSGIQVGLSGRGMRGTHRVTTPIIKISVECELIKVISHRLLILAKEPRHLALCAYLRTSPAHRCAWEVVLRRVTLCVHFRL